MEQSSPKKRIVHIIQSLDNGGCENFLLRLLPLVKEYDHTIITLANRGSLASSFEKYGISVRCINQKNLFDIPAYSRLIHELHSIRPGIVITYLAHADIVGRIIIQAFTRYPVVPWLRTTHNFPRYWIMRLFEKYTSWLVPKYLANSEAVKSLYVQKYRINPNKITVIPNGIDIDVFNKQIDIPAYKTKLGVPSDSIVVACVANLHENKGHKYLLDAFSEVYKSNKNITLLLAGEGPERQNIEAQIAKSPAKNNIKLLGRRSDVSEILACTDIFVLPTLFEGMSNALMEAMASGCAIITTNIPENVATLPKKYKYTVRPKNIEDITTCLHALINDTNSRIIVKNQVQQYATEHFNISKTIKLFSIFITNAIQRPIYIITEKRMDAIGVYNTAILSSMKKNGTTITHIELDNTKYKNRLLNFVVEIFHAYNLRSRIEQNTTVVFTDVMSFSAIAAMWLPGKKYMIFHHVDTVPFYYKYLPGIHFSSILQKFDGFICSSNYSAIQIQGFGVHSSKCNIIYCGVDHAIFKPREVERGNSSDYILSVGSEVPRKNMDTIFKTFSILRKKFPKLKLIKIGTANKVNRSKTTELAKKYDVIVDIIFKDYVSTEELTKAYTNAKLLLFPSLQEGFGLPLLEAMACGCPVITSNIAPMNEIVNNIDYQANPIDAVTLAKKCETIISDQTMHHQASEYGIQRAIEFSWDKTAEQIIECIS
ncbi:MAG: glycosyltransferase [Candidatus Andersenbacteria bacterium]